MHGIQTPAGGKASASNPDRRITAAISSTPWPKIRLIFFTIAPGNTEKKDDLDKFRYKNDATGLETRKYHIMQKLNG
jgi:hypothetical protein